MSAPHETWLRRQGLDSLDALFAVSDAEPLTKPGLDSWRERLRLRRRGNGSDVVCYLKRFRRPPRQVQREVHRNGSGADSVAGQEWAWAHRLAEAGIPCLQPIACGEEGDRRGEVRSALLTPEVAGQSLERWCATWGPRDRLVIRDLLPPMASMIARLHAAGFVHRDLYLSHVFFDPATRSLCLIDLQRMLRPKVFMRRWIVKDLAALQVSTPAPLITRTDRLRWLKAYLVVRRLDSAAKALAWRVVGKSHSIRRHEGHRQSRLRQPR